LPRSHTKIADFELPFRQQQFVSSVEVRLGFIKPFGQADYYQFKKDPRWPTPFIGNGGKEIYRRCDLDLFFQRLAEEGFVDKEHSPQPKDEGRGMDDVGERG
jgi:hypothetical protein